MKSIHGLKINQLIQTWPSGTVKSSKELAKLHISPSLAQSYIKRGWLVSIGRGVYAKSYDKPIWLGGLHCLQYNTSTIITGGRTRIARFSAPREVQKSRYGDAHQGFRIAIVWTQKQRVSKWFWFKR